MPRVSESAVVIEVRQAAPLVDDWRRQYTYFGVSEDEISKRLAAAGQPDTGQNGDSYAHDSIEAQLIYERIFRKLTRHSKGEDAG